MQLIQAWVDAMDSGSIARQVGLDSATVAAMYASLGAEASSQSE
jgi:hypothetical protein